MSKPLKLILLFGTTGLCAIIAVGVFVGSFIQMFSENGAISTFQGPGTVDFSVEKEDTEVITLWHDYETIFGGKTVRNDESLPSGYEVNTVSRSGESLPPFSHSKGRTTMSLGSTSKVAVGTQKISGAGDYQIKLSGPEDEPRIFSISEGTLGGAFAKVFGAFGVAALLGMIGLVTLIIGIVVAVSKPRQTPPAF